MNTESPQSSHTKQHRVLLVDDRPENLVFLRDYLQNKGFEIVLSLSGEEALAQLNHQSFAMVLLDLEMPELSGLEVLQRIRATPSLNTTPVAILTAHPAEDVEDDCFEAGAQLVLSKPVRLRQLNRSIQELISGP